MADWLPPPSSEPGNGASPPPPDFDAQLAAHRRQRYCPQHIFKWGLLGLAAIALGIASWQETDIDLTALVQGFPRLQRWLIDLYPPDLTELPNFLIATWETLAIAIIGTLAAMLIATPLALLVARNITPMPTASIPLRGLLNLLRAIDTAIFALFFVSVVGLGPFAGVLGVMLHTSGSMAKLYTEVLETIPATTIEAIEVTGVDRFRTFTFAVLPEALPGLLGVSLYLWEYNVRSSVILGIVGAGGIGYELLVSLKLLDFGRLSTILLLILIMVSLVDGMSAWIRQRLT